MVMHLIMMQCVRFQDKFRKCYNIIQYLNERETLKFKAIVIVAFVLEVKRLNNPPPNRNELTRTEYRAGQMSRNKMAITLILSASIWIQTSSISLHRAGSQTCEPLDLVLYRGDYAAHGTMWGKRVSGLDVTNKGGGRQAARAEARRDAEWCGQAKHKPSEQEARMCSPSPKSLRRGGKKQTPV